MQKFAYTRGDVTYSIESKVSDEDYKEAAIMFAETLDVPVATIEYLVGYGLKQSLQDAAAQPAAEAKAEGDTVKDGVIIETSAEKVAAAIKGAMDKRFDNILKGQVAMRGGAARTTDPLEAMRRSITRKKLAAWAKANEKKLPKDKEKVAALVAKFYQKNKAAIDEAAIAAVKAESEITVDFEI